MGTEERLNSFFECATETCFCMYQLLYHIMTLVQATRLISKKAFFVIVYDVILSFILGFVHDIQLYTNNMTRCVRYCFKFLILTSRGNIRKLRHFKRKHFIGHAQKYKHYPMQHYLLTI